MASDTTSLSLAEFTPRQAMIYLPQHGLDRRLLPTQGVEADLARVEIELRTDQAVGPPRIDRIAPFQQPHRPDGVRAPHEDDPTAGVGLQVQAPGHREGTTGRGRIDPLRMGVFSAAVLATFIDPLRMGVFSAAVLATFEKVTGRRIVEHFDLIT